MHLKPIVDVVTPLILFCGSHIWLSNVREPIIDSFGSLAASLNAVGTDVKFPTLIAATSRMETTGEVIPDVKLWPTEKVGVIVVTLVVSLVITLVITVIGMNEFQFISFLFFTSFS